jgi:DNA mismatch endonuclease (patch repair protein)
VTDTLTKSHRSWVMSRIRGKDTKPELLVRSLLHGMGVRFRLQGRVSVRLHPKGVLPGKPDVVLAGRRTVVFVHGCFWHRHPGCKVATMPSSNVEFWQRKFDRNVENDRKHKLALLALGWRVVVLWECELKDRARLEARLRKALGLGAAEPAFERLVAEAKASWGRVSRKGAKTQRRQIPGNARSPRRSVHSGRSS